MELVFVLRIIATVRMEGSRKQAFRVCVQNLLVINAPNAIPVITKLHQTHRATGRYALVVLDNMRRDLVARLTGKITAHPVMETGISSMVLATHALYVV
jgi:hypothetical protein